MTVDLKSWSLPLSISRRKTALFQTHAEIPFDVSVLCFTFTLVRRRPLTYEEAMEVAASTSFEAEADWGDCSRQAVAQNALQYLRDLYRSEP